MVRIKLTTNEGHPKNRGRAILRWIAIYWLLIFGVIGIISVPVTFFWGVGLWGVGQKDHEWFICLLWSLGALSFSIFYLLSAAALVAGERLVAVLILLMELGFVVLTWLSNPFNDAWVVLPAWWPSSSISLAYILLPVFVLFLMPLILILCSGSQKKDLKSVKDEKENYS